jgi:hypothetical protein
MSFLNFCTSSLEISMYPVKKCHNRPLVMHQIDYCALTYRNRMVCISNKCHEKLHTLVFLGKDLLYSFHDIYQSRSVFWFYQQTHREATTSQYPTKFHQNYCLQIVLPSKLLHQNQHSVLILNIWFSCSFWT